MAAASTKIIPPERYPSGDHKPQEPKGLTPTAIKRIVEDAKRDAESALLGTELGKLHMHGILTLAEFTAGVKYGEIVTAYNRIKGAPSPHPRSPSLEFGRKGTVGVDLDALQRMDPEAYEKLVARMKRHTRKIIKAYERADAAIPHGREVLEQLVCHDQHMGYQHHEGIKALLRILAVKCFRLNLTPPAEQTRKPRRKRVEEAKPTEEKAT